MHNVERIDEVLESGFSYAKEKMMLEKNRRKSDSREMSIIFLWESLKNEVLELKEEIFKEEIYKIAGGNKITKTGLKKIAYEAADVINFAAMICDKVDGMLTDMEKGGKFRKDKD